MMYVLETTDMIPSSHVATLHFFRFNFQFYVVTMLCVLTDEVEEQKPLGNCWENIRFWAIVLRSSGFTLTNIETLPSAVITPPSCPHLDMKVTTCRKLNGSVVSINLHIFSW